MQDTTLEKFIYVQNVVPLKICKKITAASPYYNWRPHTWYDNGTQSSKSEETQELEVVNADAYTHTLLTPLINKAILNYLENAKYSCAIYSTNDIRLNRYNETTLMRNHYDHIYTLFDGTRKGVPILSIVGILNDDYEGGEFEFWESYKPPLKAGDILIFPSNFMYPHQVKEIKKGIRYSFVSWAY